MEPIPLTEQEFESLPAGVRIIYAADQPQYRPLDTVKLEGGEGRVISRWSLTAEERKAVAEGADLYLQQLTFNTSLQPILPTIGLPQFCPADVTGSSTLEEITDEKPPTSAQPCGCDAGAHWICEQHRDARLQQIHDEADKAAETRTAAKQSPST